MKNKNLLFNFVFIIGVLILFVNDHFLKWEFHNWFTGKLSDFTGMLILPFLISFFFPKNIKLNLLVSALLFMFWKSSFSTELISLYNKIAPIRISRIVDYTDYLAFSILPLSYFLIKKVQQENSKLVLKTKAHYSLILVPTVLILMSESPPRSYYLMKSEGNFKCVNCKFTLKTSQKNILQRLRKQVDLKIDTTFKLDVDRYGFKEDNLQYYTIDLLVIEKDTLKNVEFSMLSPKQNKTTIYFNGFDYNKEISDKKMERKLRKYYKKLVKKYFSEL